jgi:hypothetical protein
MHQAYNTGTLKNYRYIQLLKFIELFIQSEVGVRWGAGGGEAGPGGWDLVT